MKRKFRLRKPFFLPVVSALHPFFSKLHGVSSKIRWLVPAFCLGLLGMGLRPSLYHQREMAKAFYYSGQFDLAKQKYELLCQMDAKERSNLAAFLFERQDYAGAEQAYRQILAALPEKERPYSPNLAWLARCQFNQGHLNDCLQSLQTMDASLQQTPMLRLKAETLQALSRTAEAALAWQAALEASKNEPGASLLRLKAGQFFDEQGNSLAAEKNYKMAYRLDNSYFGIYQLLAHLYKKTGRLAAALGRLERARIVDPKNESARQDLKGLVQAKPELLDKENSEKSAQNQKRLLMANLTVTPMPQDERIPMLRIGLLTHVSWFSFKTGSVMEVYDLSDTEPACLLATLPADQAFDVIEHRKHWGIHPHSLQGTQDKEALRFHHALYLKPQSLSSTVRVFDIAFGTGYFFGGMEDRSFRGSLELVPEKDEGLNVINYLSMEEYLLGVLPAEIDSHWPAEALRAQAIVARTDAWTKLGRHAKNHFDLCADVHCAMYRGARGERASTNRAVLESRGLVLVRPKNHHLISTLYMNSCGGHTQLAQEAWEAPDPREGVDSIILENASQDLGEEEAKQWRFPLGPQALLDWLSRTVDAYCNFSGEPMSNFRWVARYTRQELSDFVNRCYAVGDLLAVEPQQRTSSGFVRSVLFIGSEGKAISTGDHVRAAIKGLKSNLFFVETRRDSMGIPQEFLFHGGGWGHGVGFCQVGAAGRASRGQVAEEILEGYFPNAILEKRY